MGHRETGEVPENNTKRWPKFWRNTRQRRRTLPASYAIRILFSVTVVLKSFLAVATVLKSLTQQFNIGITLKSRTRENPGI
jgi:hypothetical protein